MTQTAPVKGHVHGQSKHPLSSVQCDHWVQIMIWTDRHHQGKITITKTTAGGETVAMKSCVKSDLFHNAIESLRVLGIKQYLSCHVCILIPFLESHLLLFFFDPLPIPHPFRLAFEGQEASHYYQNPREVSSTHSSPYKTLPRPPRDPRSMPPTPVMTRNAYSSSQLRCDFFSPALQTSFLLFNNNFTPAESLLVHNL